MTLEELGRSLDGSTLVYITRHGVQLHMWAKNLDGLHSIVKSVTVEYKSDRHYACDYPCPVFYIECE